MNPQSYLRILIFGAFRSVSLKKESVFCQPGV